MGRLTRVPGQCLTAPALPPFPVSAPSPWLPPIAATASPDTGVQCLEPRLRFCKAKVRVPPREVLSQLLPETLEWHPACPARALPDLLRERLQGFVTHAASMRLTPRDREAQQRPTPGAVHRTCGHVDRELQASYAEPADPRQHALPCSGAVHVDINCYRPRRARIGALGAPTPCRSGLAAGWLTGATGAPLGVSLPWSLRSHRP
jgi:hypothetical protein